MEFGMLTPKTILVPLDGSPEADGRVPFVSRLGRAVGGRFVLVRAIGHVNPATSHDSQALALALASQRAATRSRQRRT